MVDRIEEGKKLYDSGIQPTYNNDGTFSIPLKKYKFNDNTCSCMDYTMRKPIEGCKHINYIKTWLLNNKDPRVNEIEKVQDKFKQLITYIETKGNVVSCDVLYDEFDDLVDDAITHNVIQKSHNYFILLL